MTAVVVLTTVPVSFDARGLARQLVGERVAACVNIVERLTSIYRWKDAIEEEGEQLLIIKSASDRLEDLRENLLARHPYEVPEFIVISPADVAGTYLEWLVSAVSPAGT